MRFTSFMQSCETKLKRRIPFWSITMTSIVYSRRLQTALLQVLTHTHKQTSYDETAN